MEERHGKRVLFARLLPALTAVVAIAYIFLLRKYYETDVQFFKYGEIVPTIFTAAIFVISMGMIISVMLDKKIHLFEGEYNNINVYVGIISVITGVLLALETVKELMVYLNPSDEQIMLNMIEQNSTANSSPFNLTIPIIVLSFISALYFILQPFVKKIKPLGIVFIVRMVLYIIDGYFSKSSPLNSPVRILDEMCCLLIMLYFLGEMNFISDNDYRRRYLIFAPTAIFVTGLSSISSVFCRFTGFFENNENTFADVFKLSVFIYMAARYYNYISSEKPCADNTAVTDGDETEADTDTVVGEDEETKE